jgi:hypothetical protein
MPQGQCITLSPEGLSKARHSRMISTGTTYWSVRELGVSVTELSRQLKISLSAVSLSVKRGEKLIAENEKKYLLSDLLKLYI